jgi:hypothetical protein
LWLSESKSPAPVRRIRDRRRRASRFAPLRPSQRNIDSICAPAQLTVNYKRGLYVLEDTVANRRLRGTTALIREAAESTFARGVLRLEEQLRTDSGLRAHRAVGSVAPDQLIQEIHG